MQVSRRFALVVALVLLSVSKIGAAQESLSYAEELSKRVGAARAVAALGSELFGDETNWYNGETTFRVVDVDIPGNSGLPVRLVRALSAAPAEGVRETGLPRLMGNWEVELPYVSSIAARGAGWQPSNRCTTQVPQPDAVVFTSGGSVGFPTDDYWRGYSISIPGHGSGPMLKRDSAYAVQPTDGAVYPWVTSGHTQIKCVDSQNNPVNLQNGTGQGFFAVTADGVRYRFDWQIARPFKNLIKLGNGTGTPGVLHRDEVRIYATRVEDRFGNWVQYTYSGDRLTRIHSNDNREITLQYLGNEVSTVTAIGALPVGNRVWTYGYDESSVAESFEGGRLNGVTLPDGSSWNMDETPELRIVHYDDPPDNSPSSPCHLSPASALDPNLSGPRVWKFTHPNGAQADFTFTVVRHSRTQVPMNKRCQYAPAEGELIPGNSLEFDTYALTSKTLSGPGLAATTWTAAYSGTFSDTKEVTLTNPDGTKARNTFGTRFYQDEGMVLSTEVLNGAGVVVRNTSSVALNPTLDPLTGEAVCPIGINYACRIGSTLQEVEDAFRSVIVVPTLGSVVSQDGSTFSNSTAQDKFDQYARAIKVTKASNGTPSSFSKTENYEYHDEPFNWVLGQIKRVTVAQTPTGAGIEQSRTDYYAATALPWKHYSFGKLTQTLSYYADGTVLTVADGGSNTTTLSDWKRGLPQTILFPPTVECPLSCSQTAVLDDAGWIRSVTDENGDTTSYSYDTVGRISLIRYPTLDTVAWADTVIGYQVAPTGELGVASGTWRREEVTGSLRKRTYYDARLRPILEEQYDTLTGEAIYTRKGFDYANRELFASYASSLLSASSGINTFYDPLGRPTQRRTTDGVTLETVAYPTGTQRRVTDANGNVTTFSFQMFDAPSYETPVLIVAPEGQTTTIARDEFGNMTSATQSGSYQGTPVSVTRSYLYDQHMRLCKRIEPETRQRVIAYDNAGNVAWSADGQSLSTANCGDNDSVATEARTVFTYDARNRVTNVDAPGTDSDVLTTYWPTGDPQSIAKLDGSATWSYLFNKRRMLESETLVAGGTSFGLAYAYNPQGSMESLTYPSGRVVTLSPDAFGRSRAVGDFTTGASYASNIAYHASGALSGFGYGNGLAYSQTLDARLRPQSLTVTAPGENRVNLFHSYDAASNVTSIIDTGGITAGADTRQMTYDGLHRLTQVSIEGLFAQDFTTAGAQSTSIPQGVTNVTMTLHGGGGGGGKQNNGGGGGGGGALCQKSVAINQNEWGGTVNFTVGNGGASTTGGTASTLVRTFGAGAVNLSAGGGAAGALAVGGAGGVAGTGCATKINGQAGSAGGTLAGGRGGDSPQGGLGGAGATGDGQTGAPGGLPGGGGGGGGPRDLETSTPAGDGGTGGKGRVRLEWNIGTVTYSYDPLNNLRTRGGANPLSYGGYGTGDRNLLMNVSGGLTRTYSYNDEGQITGDGTRTFTWNGADRIGAVVGVASYVYDGLGKRIKTVKQGGEVEYTLYSRAGVLLYSYKPGTGESTDFVYLGSMPLVELKTVPGTIQNPVAENPPLPSQVALLPGLPPQLTSGGLSNAQTVTTYLHANLLGSPIQWSGRSVNSAPGEWLGSEHYEAYGHKLNGVADKLGYTGHAHDFETDLTYMQARFYDPQVGRFLSTDPIHFVDDNPFTFNRYSYANNNPYRYTDPDGRNPLGFLVGMVTEIGWQMGVDGKSFGELDGTDVVVAGTIGMIMPGAGSAALRAGRAGATVAKSARAVKALKSQSTKTANKAAKIAGRVEKNEQKAADALDDATGTAVIAAGAVVVKEAAQDEANKQQQQGNTNSSTTTTPPPPPPPPPPPDPRVGAQ